MREDLTRRKAIRRAAGLVGAGWLGLGLPKASGEGLPVPAAPPSLPGGESIRSCIFLFYYGGPSHLDTFDPKPDAPREVRGEYATIPTPVPGTRVCEHLPLTARVMDRVALVGSGRQPINNHKSAAGEVVKGR